MYCYQCGKEVLTGTKICPYCGANLEIEKYHSIQYQDESDKPSGVFAFLSFLFPIVGLVLYVIWHEKYPLKAKSCLEGMIAGVIIQVLFFCCMFFGALGMIL